MSSGARLLKRFVLPLAVVLALATHQALASSVVLTGLTNPAETATDSAGNLYFTADSAPGTTTLYELGAGAAGPAAVYSLSGTLPRVFDITFLGGSLLFLQSTGDYVSAGRDYALVALLQNGPVTLVRSHAVWDSGYSTVTSGSALSSLATDASGRIYYATQDWDAANGNDSASLYVLQLAAGNPQALHRYAHAPNPPAPHLLATFSGPGQNANGIIDPLAPDPNGGVYAGARSSPGIQGLYRIGLDGSVAPIAGGVAAPGPIVVWRALGFDSAGNLYAARRTFFGWQHFGCASSTAFSIFEYTPADLSATVPLGSDIADYSESGFVAWWAGSSAFNRAGPNGAAASVVSPVSQNCPSGSGSPYTSSDQVLAMPAGGGSLSAVYQDGPWQPGPPIESPPDEGPIALALDPAGNLFVAVAFAGTVTQY